ncbi:anthrone oxygenase family protein [Gryllotalpicola reticulitermitis]|uniref:Anthrone oxygenase family protein n=1 Tax=Gryllotalpicola reticulitermitis TaxID=1184153 RepID=A0ABV8QAP2_9MICO
MTLLWLDVVQIVLVGLLAGEEFIVRYGVQPALDALPDSAHVAARIALVKRLKVVVPSLMLPAVAASVAVVVTEGTLGLWWRISGLAALAVFLCFSFLGTVPINIGVNDWDPTDPPADWRHVAHRWETIDTYRSSAAILAFVLFAVAVSLRAR